MVDKVKKVWLDGEFVDWDEATIHVLTHSFHYGLAAFEGIRAYKRADGGTYVFRLREHIDRLFDSCKMCLLKPEFTREQVMAACVETLRTNGMAEGYLRPMVFIGEGAMGIYAPNNPVRTLVAGWKWGAYLGEEALKNGIRAKMSSFARLHVNVNLAKAKVTGQYTNSVLAKREAKLAGYDEAILLDANGYVSEGSGENIFVVRKGIVHTPDLSCSILEGITRDSIIALGARDRADRRRGTHHPRPALARRRGVLHRNRGGGDPRSRGGQPNRRRRHGRPHHQEHPGAFLRGRSWQRLVAPRVADARLNRGLPALSAWLLLSTGNVAAMTSCAAPRSVSPPVPPASEPAVFAEDDPRPLPRYHSKRLALALPLPDGPRWRIDDHSQPELVATHEPTRSRVRVAVFRADELVGRAQCEALARERKLVPQGELSTLEDGVAVTQETFDTRVWVAVQAGGGPERPLVGYVLAFGGFLRKCYVFSFSTEVRGAAEESVLSSRLAYARARILGGLELDPFGTIPRER